MSQDKIVIFDTTLRDGEQSPGASMNPGEKIRMASQLEKLNVDLIEAGFPIASEGDFESVSEVAKQVRRPIITALARTRKADIDRAWEALRHAEKPCIHVFIATSDIHLEYKLRKTRAQVLDEAVSAVQYARSLCPEVEFSAEDASRSDIAYLCQVFQSVIDAGATRINVPDTVGYAIPTEFGELIKNIRRRVPNIDRAVMSVHCHNDLGLAVANSIAAIQNGARQVECTINGIGERAGNASLEEVVMAVRTRKDLLPYTTDIQTEELYKSSRLLVSLTGMFIQRNKAIVGENAFAHEAGIHQDGMLKYHLNYEIMTPQSVGIKHSTLVIGKHSGRHAVRSRFKELGYELTDEELLRTYDLVMKLADKKKDIYDDDLIALVQSELTEIPETFSLERFQITSGDQVIPTATVVLKSGEKSLMDSASGDGPVDALYRAIDRVTGEKGKLLDYTIRSTSGGKDAVGEVFIRVAFGDLILVGRAASTDILEASAKAYLEVVNRSLWRQAKTGSTGRGSGKGKSRSTKKREA